MVPNLISVTCLLRHVFTHSSLVSYLQGDASWPSEVGVLEFSGQHMYTFSQQIYLVILLVEQKFQKQLKGLDLTK